MQNSLPYSKTDEQKQDLVVGDESVKAIDVEVSQTPLTEAEKALLAPDLKRRNLSLAMLDILPPKGDVFYLLRAYNQGKQLIAVTVMMNVFPFVALKNMLGEGNHVGWDISFYFAPDAPKADAIAALLNKVASRCMFHGTYFGLVDEDLFAALPKIKHHLFLTDYQAGAIYTTGLTDKNDFLKQHKRLRRHIKDFSKAGGLIQVRKGPVDPDLAEAFSHCVDSTYKYHGRKARFNRFEKYAYEACPHFTTTCQDAVHIYAELHGKIVGCQSFIHHPDRLELSEGGFLRGQKTHHAYEAIMLESIAYALEHELERVSYGGIWNHTKDRYTNKENRIPIYALAVYDTWWKSLLFGEWFVRKMLLRTLAAEFRGGGTTFKLVSSKK